MILVIAAKQQPLSYLTIKCSSSRLFSFVHVDTLKVLILEQGLLFLDNSQVRGDVKLYQTVLQQLTVYGRPVL